MQPPMNPYAPPAAGLPYSVADGGGCWRDGKDLILQAGADLPPRCVKCNRPAEMPVKPRRLYWHTPLIYLAVCASPIIYLILALILRKSVAVHPGLCPEHRQARNRNILIAWIFTVATIGCIAFGFSADGREGFIFAGFLLLVTGLIAAVLTTRIVYPIQIDPQITKLRGCGETFLASFPSLPANPYR